MSTELEVVSTEIEIKDAAVTQAGFGTLLILGYITGTALTQWRTAFGQLARTAKFADPDALLEVMPAMTTDHAVYRAALKAMSQKPSPDGFKVGLRLGAITHTIRLTPSTPTAGEIYSLLVDDDETASVTAGGSPTVASICAALTTAIDALTANVDATDATTSVTVAGITTGEVHRYEALTANLTLLDITANPATTIQTDLAAVRAYDEDWYGLALDSNSEAEINAAAAWAETQRILMFVTTQDTGAKQAGTITDIASDLRAAGYHRTAVMYHDKPASQYAGAAWAGRGLPKAPGSFTWAHKSLAGVDKSILNDTERAALKGKNCNFYIDIKGIGFTLEGKAASGRFLDITHGMDWFEVRLQERIIALFANNDKVPYTDDGLILIGAQIEGQILAAGAQGIADLAQPWSVTVPKKSAMSPNDVTARIASGFKFAFVLQGAVHKVLFQGTVRTAL